MPLVEVNFYYDEKQTYTECHISKFFEKLDLLKSKDGVLTSKVEKSGLSTKAKQNIIDEIRRIKPQARGAVVASRGKNLPISGNKNLNLINTPIILVRSESIPVYVFPCRLGERYYSVSDGLDFLLKNLPNLPELSISSETAIINMLSKSPELLEARLELVSEEKETSTGKTDLIFRDAEGRILIVEVERDATDTAVGQILRLCAGYEDNESADTRVRAGLACIRINDNVLAAARRASIEIWKVDFDKGRVSKLN